MPRFSDEARRAVLLAHDEAMRLGQDEVETEYILLGLVEADRSGIVARSLEGLGISPDGLCELIREGGGDRSPIDRDHVPLSANARRAVGRSLDEAVALRHSEIGTAHILLGIVREDSSRLARVLGGHNIDPEQVRRRVVQSLGDA